MGSNPTASAKKKSLKLQRFRGFFLIYQGLDALSNSIF